MQLLLPDFHGVIVYPFQLTHIGRCIGGMAEVETGQDLHLALGRELMKDRALIQGLTSVSMLGTTFNILHSQGEPVGSKEKQASCRALKILLKTLSRNNLKLIAKIVQDIL